jgi:hypothetical protein
VETALDQGCGLMESLPCPDNPRNHFQVDPARFDFYAMDCDRSVGEDNLALAAAETVTRSSTTPSGLVVEAMRLAGAELTQATVYARAGEVDQAMTKAEDALGRARRSLPWILLVGHEVAASCSAHGLAALRRLASPNTFEPWRPRLRGSARARYASSGAEARWRR